MSPNEYPNWQTIVTAAVIFFIGYMIGNVTTKNDLEKELKKMIETNSISFGYKISLGLTKEKQEEILDAMEFAEEDRRQEEAVEYSRY